MGGGRVISLTVLIAAIALMVVASDLPQVDAARYNGPIKKVCAEGVCGNADRTRPLTCASCR